MTRINCGIKPAELTQKHLLAEHREIKRLPNLISRGRYNLNNIPNEFTLGKGHVAFFYNKLEFVRKRYEELYTECKARGYNVTYYGDAWNNIPKEFMNDYIPTKRDEEIIRQRIKEKLEGTYEANRNK